MHYKLLLGAFAAMAQAEDVIFESLPGVPQGWTKVRDAADGQVLRLRIALQQPNKDLFEKTLYDVSTPQHPMYGKHLKKEEVKAMLKPLEESTDAVLSWLRDAGLPAKGIWDDGEVRTPPNSFPFIVRTVMVENNHECLVLDSHHPSHCTYFA